MAGIDVLEHARFATAEDKETIVSLNESFELECRQKRGGHQFLFFQKPLEEVLKSSSVVVGEFDTVVFGFAAWSKITSTRWIVSHLYVDPEARGVGIGAAMFEVFLAQLSEGANGQRTADVPALPGDSRSKNFFEGFGFKARLLTLSNDR